MLLGVFLYLLLAATISALLLLLPVRDRAAACTRRCWKRGCVAGAGAVRRWQSSRQGLCRSALVVVAGSTRRLRLRAWPLAAGLGILILVPLAAWSLRGMVQTTSPDARAARAVDEHVASLLQGEQLVPPPPLPPALFATPEVEQWVPLARQASRQWELLDPAFRQRLLLVFKLMRGRHEPVEGDFPATPGSYAKTYASVLPYTPALPSCGHATPRPPARHLPPAECGPRRLAGAPLDRAGGGMGGALAYRQRRVAVPDRTQAARTAPDGVRAQWRPGDH
jgi:hypothetical protein